MSFNRYYQDELAYLRELGAEFTKRNPELAPYLSSESRDPDVERLIEAFAFLTGRLRERLDDGVPEIIHGLLTLLWPQALRPIPCTTTLQFEPVKGVVTGTETVPRDVQILSKSVEGVACSFKTCFEVQLQPFSVVSTELEEISGRGLLRVTIAPIGEIAPDQLEMPSLRLFLNFHSDTVAGDELRLLLRRHVRSVTIVTPGGATLPLPQCAIKSVGLSLNEAVLQPSDTTFDAFRVVQEFLTIPEKFSFLDLEGLPPAATYAASGFTLVFEFDHAFQNLTRLSAEQIRLNCTPAINLFQAEADPIGLSQRLTEYRLMTSDPKHISIVDVLQVTGWVRGRADRVHYDRFEAFHRRPLTNKDYYYVRLRPSMSRHHYEHYLSFANDRKAAASVNAELVLTQITCCNGSLPELLGIGDVNRAGANAPVWARARNVSPITAFVPPPQNAMGLWSIISIMARNYYPVAHVEGLRNLLDHLNFRAHGDGRATRRQELLVQSLLAIKTRPVDTLVKGYPVRGRAITMDVNEEGMEGVGRAFLFGEVMDQFLGLFSSLNTSHTFSLNCTRSNITYDWPTRAGAIAPL